MTKKYAVVGLGGSGLSAVKFLNQQGCDVSVTDAHERPPLAQQLPDGVKCYFGGLDADLLKAVDCIVISPGVDPRLEAIAAAKQAGVRIVSDVQLFIDHLKQRDQAHQTKTMIVAITGSNAKSTVTTLVGQMAKSAGLVVGVGGNIGTPALELLKIEGMQLAVLELSSFQLEHISHLSADAATILNLSADHLDRHDGMADYLAQKLKIFEGARSAVICQDDADLSIACQKMLDQVSPKARLIFTKSQACDEQQDFYLQKQHDALYLCYKNQRLLAADQLKIKGKHNLVNALSALALGLAVDLPIDAMLKTLTEFKGLPHRCEYVDEVGQKAYFNDSKGTNIGSTLAAIDGLGLVYGEESLALILGGQGKGQDFGELASYVDRWVNQLYLVGVDARLIEEGLVKALPHLAQKIHHAKTLDVAVTWASKSQAKAVLLSPACASLDQFTSYAHRGECFVDLVKHLQA